MNRVNTYFDLVITSILHGYLFDLMHQARELTDSNYKERALVETSRTMERRIRDLEQEVSTLRQHRASDQSAVASWETRALLAEDKLKSSDARFAQV